MGSIGYEEVRKIWDKSMPLPQLTEPIKAAAQISVLVRTLTEFHVSVFFFFF